MLRLYQKRKDLSTMTRKVIIIVVTLTLAALAGLCLSLDVLAAGGGISFPDQKYHSYLPSISHSPTCPNGCINSNDACMIKGVVTGMGDKFYYTPDMEDWKNALLQVKYGGRWFCFEKEAVLNGFVRATPGCWYWPENPWHWGNDD